jgi:hypothetical protein
MYRAWKSDLGGASDLWHDDRREALMNRARWIFN